MEKIHLVTCRDPKSWSKTKKNILLGGWCYDYNKRHEYKDLEFEIINSPSLMWCDRNNIEYAKKIQNLIEEELKIFSKLLNTFHKEKFSQTYWNIILCPWISNFVSTFKIIETRLKIISKKYVIDSATFYKNNSQMLLPNDYSEGFKFLAFDGNYFNNLILKILNKNYKDVKINFIECRNYFNFDLPDLSDKEEISIKRYFKETFFKIINFLPLIEGRPFITGTVFNSIWEILFKLRNFQVPKQINFSRSYKFREKIQNREKISNKLFLSEKKDKDNTFLTDLVFKFLPCSYVENFKNNIKIKNQNKWPKKPSYIFTCYSLYYDEIFKIYAAECSEKKIPYFVGQHGNNFSTRIPYWKFPESYTANKFLVWGNKHDFKNSVETFNLRKPEIVKKRKINAYKGILLICKTSYEETNLLESTYDNQNQNSLFLNNLINNLSLDKQKDLTIRLLNENTNEQCCEEQRLRNFNSKIKIELGKLPIFKLINTNKLIIFDYDSTGFLECLSQNIPSLMFINEKELDYLKDDVLDDYDELIKLKIIHTNSNQLSKHIDNTWNNLDQWWYSDNVQNKINIFKNKYCKTVKSPISLLSKIMEN